jgi:uncharacterized RDD family membrane protein YckC
LGDWGRALGFAIALAYFGAMDSKLFGGQTLGKRIAGIKVVTAADAPLTVGASTLRAAIFLIPYFLNGAFIDAALLTSWVSELLTIAVFGFGLSIAYLLIFNRRTRQSLHDLAVGAYVVNRSAPPSGDGNRVWPVHFGVVGLIVIASAVLPLITQKLANSSTFRPLLSVQQGLQQEPEVRHATVNVGFNRFFSSGKGTTTKHFLDSKIFLSRRVTDFDSLANRSARVILERDPSANTQDVVSISIIYGYDIGIASAWRSRNFAFSPAEWRKRFTDPGN